MGVRVEPHSPRVRRGAHLRRFAGRPAVLDDQGRRGLDQATERVALSSSKTGQKSCNVWCRRTDPTGWWAHLVGALRVHPHKHYANHPPQEDRGPSGILGCERCVPKSFGFRPARMPAIIESRRLSRGVPERVVSGTGGGPRATAGMVRSDLDRRTGLRHAQFCDTRQASAVISVSCRPDYGSRIRASNRSVICSPLDSEPGLI